MKQKRIGLFKTALESLAESDQATIVLSEETPCGTVPNSVAGGDPVKTDEVQPEAQASQDVPPTSDAGGSPEQAPAEVQEAVAEVAAAAPTAEEKANAPEVAIITGVTTDEEPAVDDCEVADITDDVADLVAQSGELSRNGQDLSKAADAIDELEDLVQTAESTGVESEGGAAVLELAVEHVFNRLGLEQHHYALEDDSGVGSSMSSKISNIKEVIVRLFKALIEAIGRAAARVRDYLQRVTHVASRTALSAAQLKRRVRALPEAPVEGKLNNQRLAQQLGVFKDTSISQAFKNLHELCTGATRSAKSGYIDHLNRMVECFVQDTNGDALIEELPKVLERAFDDALPNDQVDNLFDIDNIPDGGYILASNLLPGNAVGVLVVPKTTDDLRVFSYSIERARSGNEAPELDVLNKAEMEWLLDSIISTSKMISSFHANVQAFGSLESRLSDAAKRLDKEMVDKMDPRFRSFVSALTAVAPALAQGIHEKSFAYAMQCASAGLRYVDASLKKQEAASKHD